MVALFIFKKQAYKCLKYLWIFLVCQRLTTVNEQLC